MTVYRYRAYDAAGALHLGELQAPSEADALAQLASHGRITAELAPIDASAPPARWWEIEIWSSGKLGVGPRAALLRDLATLVAAGVTLEEALRLLHAQAAATARQAMGIIGQLHRAVVSGTALSAAMTQVPQAFPDYVCKLVAAGESSGKLAAVLTEIAQFEEASAARRSELSHALMYPAILVIAAFTSLAIVAMLLVPTLIPIFRDAGVEPPLLIGALDRSVDLAARYWPVLAASAAGLGVAAAVAMRTGTFRLITDRLLLRLPIISPLIRQLQTARIARTLGTLLSNAVSLPQAARISAEALDNRVYRAGLHTVERDLETGHSLSQALAATQLLDGLHIRLVAIGEHTGNLAAMLLRIAEQCEQTSQRRIRTLMSMAAPLLTLLIGAVVGGLMLSVMSAITSLNDLVLK
jgi:general secretion pathway protein F